MTTESQIADARRDFERTFRMFYGAREQYMTAGKMFEAKQAALQAEGEEINKLAQDVQRLGENSATLWLTYMQLKEPGYGEGMESALRNLQVVPLQEVGAKLHTMEGGTDDGPKAG